MCSHLLEIGKSIRDANANLVPNEEYIFQKHFYGMPAISHKFVRHHLGSSAVTRKLGLGLNANPRAPSKFESEDMKDSPWHCSLAASWSWCRSAPWTVPRTYRQCPGGAKQESRKLKFSFRKTISWLLTHLQSEGTDRRARNGVGRRIEDSVDQLGVHRSILAVHQVARRFLKLKWKQVEAFNQLTSQAAVLVYVSRRTNYSAE